MRYILLTVILWALAKTVGSFDVSRSSSRSSSEPIFPRTSRQQRQVDHHPPARNKKGRKETQSDVFPLLMNGKSSPNMPPSGRRKLLLQTMVSTMTGLTGWTVASSSAEAARGAAELDLEFYLRDLVGGNAKEGNIQASESPPLPPPRTLNADFAAWFPTTAMTLLAQQAGTTVDKVQVKVQSFRSNPVVQRAFSSRLSNAHDILNDDQGLASNNQYAFDLTSYALWRAATELLSTDYQARDQYLRALGRSIVQYAKDRGAFSSSSVAAGSSSSSNTCPNLVQVNSDTIRLLEWFQNTIGLCSGYRVVSEASPASTPVVSNNKKSKSSNQSLSTSSPTVVFDELDDEAFASGASINPLVTIFESSTLMASLQLNGEQSRFVPDWLGPSLAALWECSAGGNDAPQRKVSWEAFFVDPVYRPNPKDYFPTEQLYQFTIAN